MGGKNSKSGPSPAEIAELKRLEEQKDAKKAENDRELAEIRAGHKKQAEMMEAEVRSRNSALEQLRNDQVESNRRNEEELRLKREEQERRALALKAQQEKERATLKLETEAEKRRLTEKYDQQTADLRKEHETEMQRVYAQKEEERKRRDQQIAEAEMERKTLLKQQQQEEMNHRKALEQKYAEHRKDVNEHFDMLNKQLEQQTRNELERIAKTTEKKLEIVDENYQRVRKDAIETFHANIVREYLALTDRVNKMKDVTTDMIGMITDGLTEVPYEVKILNSEHNTELSLVEKQMRELKNRMKTCFDVSDNFKNALMAPLEALERSCSDTKGVSFKIIVAVQKNNVNALEDVKQTLKSHLKVTEDTLAKVDSLEFREHVENALGDVAQLSITR